MLRSALSSLPLFYFILFYFILFYFIYYYYFLFFFFGGGGGGGLVALMFMRGWVAGGWVVSVRIVLLSCTVRCGTASFLHGSVRYGKLPARFGAVRFGAVRRNCIVETPMIVGSY